MRKGPQRMQKQRNHSVRRERKEGLLSRFRKSFSIGDSVMIFPDKRSGMCAVENSVNEHGMFSGSQLSDKKIYINQPQDG